jgi:hypothetical protein
MRSLRAGQRSAPPLYCGVSRQLQTTMTINGVLDFADTAVRWVDLAFVVGGLALCAFLSPAFLWPDPNDPHGGAYQLVGVLILMPATVAAYVAWLSTHRRAAWRWWAQLFPFAMLFGVEALFDAGLLGSGWMYSFVATLPLIAAVGYGYFGRRRAT